MSAAPTEQHTDEIPRATAAGRSTVENTNLMVFGMKGSGKSTWVEEVLVKNKRRLLIVDTLGDDYSQGEIFTELAPLLTKLSQLSTTGEFRFIARVPGQEEQLFELLRYSEARRRPLLMNATVLVEEISNWTDSYNMNEAIGSHLAYGRHAKNNLIGVSRYPYEIHRQLTRQTDIVVSFKQVEANDLKYFRDLNPEAAGDLRTLERGDLRLIRGTPDALLEFIQEP